MNNTLKIIVSLLAAAVISVAAAYVFSNTGVVSFEKSTTVFEEITQTTRSETTFKDTTVSESASTSASSKPTTAKPTQKSASKSVSSTKKTTVKATAKTTVKTTAKAKAAKAKKTTVKKAPAKTTKAPQKTTKKENSIYLTIDCRKALANIDKFSEEKQTYISRSGYIVRDYIIPYKKGETVYDAVEDFCKKNDLEFGSKDTQFGKYITSINNLSEKDASGTSGWLYYVNDSFPNFSLGDYYLKAGDRIKMVYTV